MCDDPHCNDPDCPGGEDLELSSNFMAAAARMDALSEVLRESAKTMDVVGPDLGTIDGHRLAQAYAVTIGESLEELRALMAARAGDVVAGVVAGAPLQLAARGPMTQAFVFGWLLRDEQLKAERAATAPPA